MTPTERRATLLLAAILILRMTALFMVLPVLAPYALALAGEPTLAVGIAIGAYGLTQAFLQIPFGWMSDRIGRKPIIAIGLVIFACGSVMAASVQSIELLVVARLLQGGGAIAAASTALLSDLTRESVRTTAMAIIGASIGGSFLLALILGPALLSLMPVPGLFALSAIGAVLALVLLLFLPAAPPQPRDINGTDSILTADLLSLDFSVFALHAMLASLFLGLPLMLEAEWNWPSVQHWHLYLPVMLLSLVPVMPLIRYLEKRGQVARMMPFAVLILTFSPFSMGHAHWLTAVGLWLFFCAFNFLEASLPSRLASIAPPGTRGRAMGVFSSSQFLGAFVGATAGGFILVRWDAAVVLWSSSLWAMLWLGLLIARKELQNALGLIVSVDSMGESMPTHQMTQSRSANESRN